MANLEIAGLTASQALNLLVVSNHFYCNSVLKFIKGTHRLKTCVGFAKACIQEFGLFMNMTSS